MQLALATGKSTFPHQFFFFFCFLGGLPTGTWQLACRALLLITLEETHVLGMEAAVANRGERGLISLREMNKITTRSGL